VDISSLADDAERYAAIQQITEFGQTPKLLFTRPHPPRGAGCSVPHSLSHSALPLHPHPHRQAREGERGSGGGGGGGCGGGWLWEGQAADARAQSLGSGGQDRERVMGVARGEADGGDARGGGGGVGGWGRRALEEAALPREHEGESELEQAALDAAVAVVAGRGGFVLPPSLCERRSGGGDGGVGGGQEGGQEGGQGGLRPLVEGSDSDADGPSWTAEVRSAPPCLA